MLKHAYYSLVVLWLFTFGILLYGLIVTTFNRRK